MSTTCIYKEFAVRVPATTVNMPEDQFMLISLIGDNNCYLFDNKTRARSWGVSFVGSREAHIANALCLGGDFDGQMLVWRTFGRSGCISPQDYLGKVRRMLNKAEDFRPGEDLMHGGTLLMVRPKLDTSMEQALSEMFKKAAEHYEKSCRYNGYDLIQIVGNAYD